MVCALFVLANYKRAKSSELTATIMQRNLSCSLCGTEWLCCGLQPTVAAVSWLIVWCTTASGHSGQYSPIQSSIKFYCLWTMHTQGLSTVTGANTWHALSHKNILIYKSDKLLTTNLNKLVCLNFLSLGGANIHGSKMMYSKDLGNFLIFF